MDFVTIVLNIKNFLFNLGASLLLPIVITILGLIFGQKFRTALRAGLTLGAGFISLNLVISLLINNMVPVANALVENTGANLDIFDVGWGVAGAIAWGTTAGSLVILVCLGTNIVMLALKLTKTLNVDIWNFWNQAFTASVCYIASGSLAWGLVAAAIHTVYELWIADITAKDVQEFYNLPGISIPHGWAVSSVPIIAGVNWVLDRIPGVKDIHWDESNIREKWGIFGEPLFLGVLLGIVVGAIGGMWKTPAALLTLGITVGTAMILIPKIIGFFMEALTPIAESAKTFMEKKFGGREFYIGLDSAVLIGHPVTVAAGIIMIPIVLGLALILPGNRVLPFGDLAATFYFVAMVPFMSKGNLFRSIVCGTVIFVVVLYACTSFGSSLTQMATSIGYAIPEGAVEITGLSAGNWVSAVLFQIGKLIGG
ncbi:MAG: PTS galactitol transporter subunit IIC [Anaerolineae bacterium]|jgi:PTS system galactitol-specific IIC component|nr:PTS galactitol transporter subunit IIC [Anaerolineae bacterium]